VKVAAALSWYAETPESLIRCVKSLNGYCDSLVALGGRWVGFPEVAGDNYNQQAAALAAACEQTNLAYFIETSGVWPSQVAKRAELMGRACEESDWVFVIDGDEYIGSGDPDTFREILSMTERDVARVFACRVPLPYGRNIHRVYRSSAEVTVRTAHNGYVTSDGRFLHGDPCYVTLEPHQDTDKSLVLVHDLKARGQTRKNARTAYNQYRRHTRIEAWTQ
jgi:hypothetical protein